MAMISSPITDVIGVHSNNKGSNEKEHLITTDESDISKDISKCNNKNKVHNQKGERNVENLRDIVYDTVSSSGDSGCYSHERIENNEVSDISANNSSLINGIDLNKCRKEDELRVNDTYCDRGNNTTEKISKRFLNLVDTDSEDDTLYETLKKKSFTADDECHSKSPERLQIANHKKKLKNKKIGRMIDSESEEDIQTSNINGCSQTDTTTNSYQALIDSESEEEKEIAHNSFIASKESDISESKNAKKKLVKKRKGSMRTSKDEAMHQIHSETQRLLRQMDISLPYHRPKQRTLQEFLNRKKISTALPKAFSTAAKLKMSSVIVSQVVAEKEKEAELFYKSSDSEDDTQHSVSFANKDIEKSSTTNEEMSMTDIKHTCVKDFENIEVKSQDLHSEKEIVQNHSYLNIAKVSCKKGSCNTNHQDGDLSHLIKDSSNRNDDSDILPQQIVNEQNLQKLGVSRKLFDTCPKNKTSKLSVVSHDAQEIVKDIIETIITFLDKEKCIDDKMKPEIYITDNHVLTMSQAHQCDSGLTNEDRDNNLIIEATKISQNSSNTDNEKITEILRKDNDMADNVGTSINCDNCIVIKDGNNERKSKCIETDDISLSSPTLITDTRSDIQDDSLMEKCEKSSGHVLGLPLPKFTNETLIDRKKLLPTSLQKVNSKVTLKGSPGMIIDLTDDAKPNGKGVNTLLDRFFYKHVVNTKKQTDSKPEVTVIHLKDTQNGPVLIKEVLPYKLPLDIDNSELSKPGAKLMRLKEDLKLQMTLKRNKEWKYKEIEAQEKEKRDEEKESDYDLDLEQEKDNYLELIDSEESEPEENDVLITDKKRNKYLFADDEAEVTDDEDSNTEETCNESDTDGVKRSNKQSTNFKYEKEHIDDDTSESETDQEEDLDANIETGSESNFKDDNVDVCKNSNIVKNKKDKGTNQLIEEFQNNSITNSSYSEKDNNKLINTDIDTSQIHCEDNDWISESESNIPAYQQHAEITTRSQICKTPLTKTSMLDFVSPITQLSVLNTTLDSNKKNSWEKREYLDNNNEFVSMKCTQSDESSEHTYNLKNKTVLKKKLFDDVGETIDDEYLMRLCSGKFESTQRADLDLFSQSNTTKLPGLCSGDTRIQLENPEVENETSQNIKLTLDEDSHNFVNRMDKVKEISAIAPEIKLRIVSSDTEDEDTFLKPKKHSVKRLNLSDSEEETAPSSDEESNGIDNEEADEQYIDYDSEENEMIVIPGKDIKKVAADFLEEEAELSESDWDSADEDEKDLDKLEFEEADEEHIDEDEMKDQLEKIHMKQILDEDKRDVRLLKELLFEDGDLHTDGTGRERKLKWRNIDKLGNDIEMSQASDENDGWVDVQEDEEEAKWSKLKRERDKFLEQRTEHSSNEIEDELCDSQIFKFGLNALKKIKNNEPQRQDSSLDKTDPSENMEPIMPRNITDLLNGPNTGKKSQTIYNLIKRRSLLTRGEESLARIASLAKQSDSISHTVNTRNFVFQYIDPCTDNTFKKGDEMRKEKETGQVSQTKPRKRKMSDISLISKKSENKIVL